jgi:glutathione reductase (NADPH)
MEFRIQKVRDEGTAEPFIARLWLGLMELRDQALQGASSDLEQARRAFDDAFWPVLDALDTLRDAAKRVRTLLTDHRRKVESGAIVSFQAIAFGIDESIDLSLRQESDRFLTSHAKPLQHGTGVEDRAGKQSRVPEVDDIDLPAAGVEWDERGVKVNEYLQSMSNPAVYAAGDAAASGGPPLTPVAGYEGRIVAANILNRNKTTADYKGIPSVAFTVPPLAAVGLQEAAARQQGLRFRVHKERTSGWYSSRRSADLAARQNRPACALQK